MFVHSVTFASSEFLASNFLCQIWRDKRGSRTKELHLQEPIVQLNGCENDQQHLGKQPFTAMWSHPAIPYITTRHLHIICTYHSSRNDKKKMPSNPFSFSNYCTVSGILFHERPILIWITQRGHLRITC